MAEQISQNFENHVVRPTLWLAALLLILSGFVAAGLGLVVFGGDAGPTLIGAGVLLNGAGSFIGIGLVRHYAVKLQDRIIRAEMRVRLEKILPADAHSSTQALSMKQLVGLRFASDAEMPELLRKVVNEDIRDSSAIKKLVRDWQGDFHRV